MEIASFGFLEISLGFGHNFGGVDVSENGRSMAGPCLDHGGITHFDLATITTALPEVREENFGRTFTKTLAVIYAMN